MNITTANTAGILAVLVWSSVIPLVSLFESDQLFLLISLGSFITFGTFLIKWIAARESIAANMKMPLRCLAGGIIANGVYRWLVWGAVMLSAPMEACILAHLWVVLTVVFERLMKGAGLSGWQWAGFVLGIASVAAVLAQADWGPGHAMALISAMIWGAYVPLAKREPRCGGNAVGVGYLVTAILFLGLSAWLEAPWEIGAKDLVLVAVLGTVGSLGSMLWDIGMRHGRGRALAVWSLFLPLLAGGWLLLLGTGTVSTGVVAGMLLLLAGALAVSPYTKGWRIVYDGRG